MTPPFRPYITSRVGVAHNGYCKTVHISASRVYLTANQLLVYRRFLSACPVCIGSAAWNNVHSGVLTIDEPAEVAS